MWSDRSAASLSRVEEMLEFLKAEIDPDYAVFSMVLRESQALAQQTEVKNQLRNFMILIVRKYCVHFKIIDLFINTNYL